MIQNVSSHSLFMKVYVHLPIQVPNMRMSAVTLRLVHAELFYEP